MSLHPVPPERYGTVSGLIDPEGNGAIYSYSVAEGNQPGILYTDKKESILLVHHFCGFALLYGKYSEETLREIGEKILHPEPYSRMILFTPDEQAESYFVRNNAFSAAPRLFFRYNSEEMPPTDPSVSRITPELLSQIKGGITPAFSWDNMKIFLQKGVGYCVVQDGIPAGWAFSAAVSMRETDIGVETDARYRRQGFAYKSAAAVIYDALQQGKKPVWACHEGNTGSRKLAEALGFSICGQCMTVTRSVSQCVN